MNRKGFRDPRFDDLPAYALGALGPEEKAQVEDLLARSEGARRELAAMLETAASLHAAAPQVNPPAKLKAGLFAAIAANRKDALLEFRPAIAGKPLNGRIVTAGTQAQRPATFTPGRSALAASLTALAAAVVLAVFFGMRTAALQNDLDSVNRRMADERAVVDELQVTVSALKGEVASASEKSGEQGDQVSRLAQANEALQAALMDQRWLTYVTFERDWAAASWLRPEPDAPGAQGQIVVSPAGDRAALFVDGMPPLAEGSHYLLWLMGAGWRWEAAAFTVDEQGYARVDISLPGSVAQFTDAVITRESTGEQTDVMRSQVVR